jgi:DNA repair exonuclease SbcCD ATPase subunit
VSSFEEFAFLQLFVFTFDEQRKTLFWNPRIIDRVLYRAFGVEPDMAKKADSMWREIEQEDSRVRNYQWEATRMRKRINQIRSHSQESLGAQQAYDALAADHKTLSDQFEEESKILHELEDALKDTKLRLAEYSMNETSLRDEYARYFDSRFDFRPPLAQHPLVTQSLAEHVCQLCGSGTDAALEVIAARAQGTKCPLCDSGLKQSSQSDGDASRLQEIDLQLTQATGSIKDVLKTLERLRTDHANAHQQWQATKKKLDEFDRQNNGAEPRRFFGPQATRFYVHWGNRYLLRWKAIQHLPKATDGCSLFLSSGVLKLGGVRLRKWRANITICFGSH